MTLVLSGFSKTTFADAAERLIGLAKRQSLREFSVSDLSGNVNRSIFQSGSGLDDALRILRIDLQRAARVSCRFALEDEDSISIDVVRSVDELVGIEGQAVGAKACQPTSAESDNVEVRGYLSLAAVTLDAIICVSHLEESGTLFQGPIVRSPTALTVVGWKLQENEVESLRARGVHVTSAGNAILLASGQNLHDLAVIEDWIFRQGASLGLRARS